jgi:hypothetical protein
LSREGTYHIYDTEEKKEYFREKASIKKMGYRKNKFMAQQIQEIIYKI